MLVSPLAVSGSLSVFAACRGDGSCNICVSLAEFVDTDETVGAPSTRKFDDSSVERCDNQDDNPWTEFFIFIVMNVYVLVPLIFSFIDAPFSGSLKSPLCVSLPPKQFQSFQKHHGGFQ